MQNYKTTVHIDQKGHRTIVHEPIRTPKERIAWLAKVDRAVREAFPGWGLANTAVIPEKEE